MNDQPHFTREDGLCAAQSGIRSAMRQGSRRERGTYRDGEAVKNLNTRTSRIFRLIDGCWRQMHHHGSIEDAKLLGDYQSAVRSASARTP